MKKPRQQASRRLPLLPIFLPPDPLTFLPDRGKTQLRLPRLLARGARAGSHSIVDNITTWTLRRRRSSWFAMESRRRRSRRTIRDLVDVAVGEGVPEGVAAGLQEDLGRACEVEEELLELERLAFVLLY